ncbi:unnamed protein product, partial [Mesorhabditis spiculigera]
FWCTKDPAPKTDQSARTPEVSSPKASSPGPPPLTQSQQDEQMAEDTMNNLTVRSIQQMVKQRGDIYGGDFGRVRITKAQLDGEKS